jgi:hypothetical protein
VRPHFALVTCGLAHLAFVHVALAAEAPSAQPPPARSGSTLVLTSEVGLGQTKPSPDTPTSSYFYQRIGARWTPGERWDLVATFRATEDLARPPDTGSTLATGGDAVLYGALDATYDFATHWSASVGANGSPTSSRDVAIPNPVTPASAPLASPTEPDVLVRAKTLSAGATAELGYDSFDDDVPRSLDVAIDASAAFTEFLTEQTPVRPAAAATALGTNSASLAQGRFGLTATLTVLEDTDVALDAAYFVYDDPNPGDVGTFATLQAAGASWGAGLPMLPPRWTIRPELVHRFGPLSLRGYYQYADLAIDGASGQTVGGKIQVAIERVKLFVNGSYRADSFPGDQTTQTWSVGAGFAWRL